jgi:hypothetical protein
MTVIIFYAVVGQGAALVAGGCALVLFVAFWLVLPLSMRNAGHKAPDP